MNADKVFEIQNAWAVSQGLMDVNIDGHGKVDYDNVKDTDRFEVTDNIQTGYRRIVTWAQMRLDVGR